MSDPSEQGFVQDYDLGVKQELWLYCRLCRTTFPVTFKPKSAKVRLKCVCGHEGPLGQLDVFRSELDCREHSAFYERVYRAAKGALRDAGFPVPPSGKWSKVEDLNADSSFESYFHPGEEESAIADGYIEPDDSDVSPASILAAIEVFDERLEDSEDVLERHEILSEMIVWTYCRRHLNPEAYRRFYWACQEDIDIAREVINATKQAMRDNPGRKIKLKFTSFKHLVVDLEQDQEPEKALVIAQKAANLGLKGYAKRAAKLRARLGL